MSKVERAGDQSGTWLRFGAATNCLFCLYLNDYSVNAGRRSGGKQRARHERLWRDPPRDYGRGIGR
jgi:hypothetical protein